MQTFTWLLYESLFSDERFPVNQDLYIERKRKCFNCFRLVKSSTQHNLSKQHEPMNNNIQLFLEYVSNESNEKEVISCDFFFPVIIC